MASVPSSEPANVRSAAAAADDARNRVSATIDDIQDRLSPRRILSDTVERIQTGSRAFASQAEDVAKAHPVAIGAAVAALGLALFARNRLAKATVNLAGVDDYTDYDDGYGTAESGAFDDFAPRVESVVADTRESVGANPGVAIVVGLAAGAALGALLPVSETERRTLGQTSNRLSSAARAAARVASDELDAHGLGLGNVRAKAGEATQKARSAARSALDAAKAELKS
ncbi:DUF3618 domain-containing protein [Polymorphobacter fuscus]|uniref:DUF3618 domain-containing protein n=1 Tax=Sandarakinorhabdus fusca TaxID=1439888 RepID=A0A7C9GSL3_9SPHN|nr:DUF3618 domain-containing protein [Polymorphobacter fuscus]KAB7648345.1 DUF3618 domain-containing protein [Polymorphobacter fuscus]MQT15858.1 DUF3618 domain-containing protein [Polymorphobacter fuscus]NJC07869.1 ElaB/YqjD/DUF883 family membrane-anchored ribosome-binding protein [Polymorphobacter fuscus]